MRITSFKYDLKNGGPLWQYLWHVKEPLLLKAINPFTGKAIVMFLSVLHHLKIQKPTSQQGRKTNKNLTKSLQTF
jgi:hypothetical protein